MKPQKKTRRVLNDEERILQLRSELTERADRSELEERLEIRDDDEIGDDESYDESENMDSDEASLLEKDHTAKRLDDIERKLGEIKARLKEKDKEQENDRRKINRMKIIGENYCELMLKIERLEKENNILKDENWGLKNLRFGNHD